MERLKEQLGLEVLQNANEGISQFFARFSGAPVLGTEEEVEEMLRLASTLRSVGALLDGHLHKQGDALRDELVRYRANLLRLQAELGAMQSAAAVSRDRLLTQQKHLNAAKAWCMASRATT
ncbi:MAG TPA: hypothetical protein VKB58_15075 [Terriglobales bacterium]|jgi:hypothetical protein|nr:hypothetical protein [Terriglobales bacterium]